MKSPIPRELDALFDSDDMEAAYADHMADLMKCDGSCGYSKAGELADICSACEDALASIPEEQ